MGMNPRLLRPSASGFNPKSISGLELWLDASDSSSYTLATGVSEWRDKSGNGRKFAQGVGNNQPSTSTLSNGKTAFLFDGSNDSLANQNTLSLASTHSIFAVVTPNVRKIQSIIAGANNAELIYGDGSSSFSGTKFAAFGVGRAVYGGGTINTAVNQIVSIVCSGGSLPADLSMWTNGTGGAVTVETAGTAPTAAVTHPITIGTSTSNQFWNGLICEVLVYSKSLQQSDRQKLERWLGSKWGITVA